MKDNLRKRKFLVQILSLMYKSRRYFVCRVPRFHLVNNRSFSGKFDVKRPFRSADEKNFISSMNGALPFDILEYWLERELISGVQEDSKFESKLRKPSSSGDQCISALLTCIQGHGSLLKNDMYTLPSTLDLLGSLHEDLDPITSGIVLKLLSKISFKSCSSGMLYTLISNCLVTDHSSTVLDNAAGSYPMTTRGMAATLGLEACGRFLPILESHQVSGRELPLDVVIERLAYQAAASSSVASLRDNCRAAFVLSRLYKQIPEKLRSSAVRRALVAISDSLSKSEASPSMHWMDEQQSLVANRLGAVRGDADRLVRVATTQAGHRVEDSEAWTQESLVLAIRGLLMLDDVPPSPALVAVLAKSSLAQAPSLDLASLGAVVSGFNAALRHPPWGVGLEKGVDTTEYLSVFVTIGRQAARCLNEIADGRSAVPLSHELEDWSRAVGTITSALSHAGIVHEDFFVALGRVLPLIGDRMSLTSQSVILSSCSRLRLLEHPCVATILDRASLHAPRMSWREVEVYGSALLKTGRSSQAELQHVLKRAGSIADQGGTTGCCNLLYAIVKGGAASVEPTCTSQLLGQLSKGLGGVPVSVLANLVDCLGELKIHTFADPMVPAADIQLLNSLLDSVLDLCVEELRVRLKTEDVSGKLLVKFVVGFANGAPGGAAQLVESMMLKSAGSLKSLTYIPLTKLMSACVALKLDPNGDAVNLVADRITSIRKQRGF